MYENNTIETYYCDYEIVIFPVTFLMKSIANAKLLGWILPEPSSTNMISASLLFEHLFKQLSTILAYNYLFYGKSSPKFFNLLINALIFIVSA